MSVYKIKLIDDRRPGEKRVWWSEVENKWLLDYIKDMQVVKSLVRKRQKNADIFKTIETKMNQRGSSKTWQQIRSRWKRMKSEYIREKKLRSKRRLRRAALPEESAFFKMMTNVLGKYSDQIECPSAYLGEDDDDEDKKALLSCLAAGTVLENGGNDGEIKVQVELIEGDGVLDQNMTVIDSDVQEIKQELPSLPASPHSTSDVHQEQNGKDSSHHSMDTSEKDRISYQSNSSFKAFADEYAQRHAKYMSEWQEQYQEWFEKQIESQQQWEETFMQEQMELAKSMLENVATTFVQSMQQVLQNVVSSMRHRTLTPFIPSFPQRNVDINVLSGNEYPVFLSADGTSNNGPTVLSTRSLADESFNNM